MKIQNYNSKRKIKVNKFDSAAFAAKINKFDSAAFAAKIKPDIRFLEYAKRSRFLRKRGSI